MKLAMAMTLDGLMRALRWRAHDLAESKEGRYAAGARDPARAEWPSQRRHMQAQSGEADDDRSRR
ncbi:hypothetical protein ATER59S_03705 [Aquamicrobium terrae]